MLAPQARKMGLIDCESMDAAEKHLDALRQTITSFPRATYVLLLPDDPVLAKRAVDLRPTVGGL